MCPRYQYSYEFARRALGRLSEFDSVEMRDLITDTFVALGDISAWNDVFKDDSDMLKRFKDNEYRVKDHGPYQ